MALFFLPDPHTEGRLTKSLSSALVYPKRRRFPAVAIAIVSLPQGSEVDVYDFVMSSEPKCGPTSMEKPDKGIDWHSRCMRLWLRCLW